MSMSKLYILGAGLIMVAAAGCVPNSSYIALQEQYDAVAANNTELQGKLDAKEQDLKNVHKLRMHEIIAATDIKREYEIKLKGLKGNSFGSSHAFIDGKGVAVLGGTSFRPGSVALNTSAKKFLDSLAPQLKSGKIKAIEIVGSTDKSPLVKSKPKYGTNLILGSRRAESVARYLMSKGVSESKLRIKSLGSVPNKREVKIKAIG